MRKIQNIQEILDVYRMTGSTKKTAELLSIKRTTVQYIAKKNGVLKNRYESQRRYNYNEHYFDVIDNEHKAYWLGFIYADGCVCYEDKTPRFQFILSARDKNILQQFANDIESNAPLNVHTKKSGKFAGTQNVGLHIRSKHLCDSLENLGCVRRKSKIAKFPIKVPESLIHHFIRGYFDGDGSAFISHEKHWRRGTITDVLHFRFIGTFDVVSKIDKYLGLNGQIRIQHPESNNELYELSYKRRKKARIFYEYLYSDATIWLERKRNVFDLHLKKDVQRL